MWTYLPAYRYSIGALKIKNSTEISRIWQAVAAQSAVRHGCCCCCSSLRMPYAAVVPSFHWFVLATFMSSPVHRRTSSIHVVLLLTGKHFPSIPPSVVARTTLSLFLFQWEYLESFRHSRGLCVINFNPRIDEYQVRFPMLQMHKPSVTRWKSNVSVAEVSQGSAVTHLRCGGKSCCKFYCINQQWTNF